MRQPNKVIWLWPALMTIIGLLTLTSVFVRAPGREYRVSQVPRSDVNVPQPSDQVVFQRRAEKDVAGLFEGLLLFSAPASVDVGDTAEFAVTLAALEDELPAEAAVEHRSLLVGGVEGASLEAPDGDVGVELIGSARQVLTRGAPVEWRWALTPRRPGRHRLDLVVETYQGSSDDVLWRTTPPIKVELNARGTFGYWLGQFQGWIIAASAVVGALTVIFALFRKPLFALVGRLLGGRGRGSGAE
ncbi:hypothetical protein [Streptomyces sp. NPDC127112]|uniref:hypothetical protein n=1 Tax=Streptomyces sp. NPDC127112 TaxID=3345364 RepID=UPI00363C8F7C